MILPPLFHWSPRERRESIRLNGLQPFSEPVVQAGHAFAYICLGTDPRSAWVLSGDLDWVKEVAEWDLWQVQLAHGDEVHFLGTFNAELGEVRVHMTLPPDRVWLVGTRDGEHPAAEPVKATRKRSRGARARA